MFLHGVGTAWMFKNSKKPFVADYGDWSWAAVQWLGYSGPYVSIAVSLALLGTSSASHSRPTQPGNAATKSRPLGGLFRSTGHSLLAAAIVWVLLYLALAPFVTRFIENNFQTRMAYLRNPQAYYDDLNKAIAEARVDMNWLESPAESEPAGDK